MSISSSLAPRPAKGAFTRIATSRWVPIIGFFLLVFLAPGVLSPARLIIAGTCGIYALYGMGLCATFSYTGYPSMAQAGLASAAAFTMAVLAQRNVVSPVAAIFISIAAVALLAFVLAFAVFLVRGFYFAMVTLLLGSIATVVIGGSLASYTGGFDQGIAVETPTVFGVNLADFHDRFYVVWAIVAVGAVVFSNLERTRIVRRARAVKGDERVSQLNGVRPLYVKLQMFVLSSVLISVASLLLAFSSQYATLGTFDTSLTITIFAGLVVGGRSTVWGAIVGALFVVVVNELLRDIPILHSFQTRATLIYGVVMAGVLLWAPGGLVDIPRLVRQRRRPPSTEIDARTLPTQPRSWERALQTGEVEERPVGQSLLQVESLSVKYGDFVAVRDVTFDLESGDILGIMGPNGAGKTTILNAISGYVRPTSGFVHLRGVDITGLSVDAIRRAGVSRTLQTPHVYDDLTVWENIALGVDFTHRAGLLASALALPHSRRSERTIRDEAAALAEIVGLSQYTDRLGGELSFGQRRLVEIARALGGHSRLLLLDEPMAGLSPAMAHVVQELVIDVAGRGYGVVLIEHNFDHVEAMARHGIFIASGRVTKRGSIAEILADRQVIEEYVGV